MELPDGKTESDTKRDGAFSYAGEYHACAIGIAAGVVSAQTQNPELAIAVLAVALGGSGMEAFAKKLKGNFVVNEISREPWYACFGVGVGVALVAFGDPLVTALL